MFSKIYVNYSSTSPFSVRNLSLLSFLNICNMYLWHCAYPALSAQWQNTRTTYLTFLLPCNCCTRRQLGCSRAVHIDLLGSFFTSLATKLLSFIILEILDTHVSAYLSKSNAICSLALNFHLMTSEFLIDVFILRQFRLAFVNISLNPTDFCHSNQGRYLRFWQNFRLAWIKYSLTTTRRPYSGSSNCDPLLQSFNVVNIKFQLQIFPLMPFSPISKSLCTFEMGFKILFNIFLVSQNKDSFMMYLYSCSALTVCFQTRNER